MDCFAGGLGRKPQTKEPAAGSSGEAGLSHASGGSSSNVADHGAGKTSGRFRRLAAANLGPSTSSFYKLGLSCVPAGITTSPPPPPWPPPQPSPRRVRLPSSNATFVSFPRRPLPATTLALSQLSLVPAANPKYHNAKVDAGDEDVDGEELLRRFNWQVSRAGVMEEIRRRRRHEDARDKRKRKARSAARRFRRRRFKGPFPFSDDQGAKEQTTDDEENDNWDLPAGELPSYR
ncbi:uncharacterized protein [Miscanthus floridulus]|uniref:uncharacterized protein n=1 Tax=Miscanthus floridulus TaxID=154761 RepID=UPI003458CC23